jgi:hypothetical protein
MKVITQGLTETQQLEAVMMAARVDEARARAMLDEQHWDVVVVDGNVLVGPSLVEETSKRASDSAAIGELVELTARALFGEVGTREGSGTIFFEPPAGGRRRELVEH